MKILIIGGGGREHALAWKLSQSPRCEKLFIAPGNGGTVQYGENVDIAATDVEKLLAFAVEKKIDLTIVGPENPLDLGVVDAFKAAGLKIFGPTKAAAQIESSKAFAKALMQSAGVPTAKFKAFNNPKDAMEYARKQGVPIVVKDSGLVFGKGVHICETLQEAEAALEEIFSQPGSKEVVIEDFLEGPEISIHAICSGTDFVLFPASQDHKRIGDGDTGKMTGGIGAVSPLPFVTPELMKTIGDAIVRPILTALSENGTPFSGLLYPGLILTKSGPKVLEFNSRFGDPECELYMRILKSDILPVFEAVANGNLRNVSLEYDTVGCVNLILCSGGYPDEYKKGIEITGIEEAESSGGRTPAGEPRVVVFHAGTVMKDGKLVTNGGRVLSITARSETLRGALDLAYEAAGNIHFDGMHYRKDIGAKAL